MNFQLKERREEILSVVSITDTFKIPESSFIFMKMDVAGLTVTVKPEVAPGNDDPAPKRILVRIPEGKTPVICLSTGKAQFLNLNEKVQIVEFDSKEIISEKESR